MTETVAEILVAYRSGAATPADMVARSYARIRAHNDPAIFIALRQEADVVAEAQALARNGDKTLPLYGIAVAIKDNIDVKGMPTTAACPAFSYSPHKDATAVARLRAAGALILGKTNLDQFATGLVGVRSTTSSYQAGRALARRLRSPPALPRWRSAPIPPDRAACRRHSATSSGSSRAVAWCRARASFRRVARWTVFRSSRLRSTMR
jgi:Asp-tRNA(Asn)/Glu-tRNA(Gln) amidotransferase A subunit family amidase